MDFIGRILKFLRKEKYRHKVEYKMKHQDAADILARFIADKQMIFNLDDRSIYFTHYSFSSGEVKLVFEIEENELPPPPPPPKDMNPPVSGGKTDSVDSPSQASLR